MTYFDFTFPAKWASFLTLYSPNTSTWTWQSTSSSISPLTLVTSVLVLLSFLLINSTYLQSSGHGSPIPTVVPLETCHEVWCLRLR